MMMGCVTLFGIGSLGEKRARLHAHRNFCSILFAPEAVMKHCHM